MLLVVMKNRIGVTILILVCLGLGVAVMIVKRRAAEQHERDTAQLASVSNQLTRAGNDLEEQKRVNVTLEKDFDLKKKDFEKSLGDLTNSYTQVSSNLAQSAASLKTAEAALKDREAKIADLEAQNQALDKKADSLNADINKLTGQIEDTKRRLAASEGDKTFLQKELQRLMVEKTELERQFNDLAVVRAQVAKLKSEAAIARRLEWSRLGVLANSEEKGAQRLMQGLAATQPRPPRPNYDLNVEVSSDGRARVIPPLTNAPSNPPPR